MPKLEIGSKVRYLGRLGFVTGMRLPGGRRVGGEVLAIGGTVATVVLSDGLAPPQTFDLPESKWDELEILPDS